VIAFNWKEGTKTVTLAELESAMRGGNVGTAFGNSFYSSPFEGSHLGDSRPPRKLPKKNIGSKKAAAMRFFCYLESGNKISVFVDISG